MGVGDGLIEDFVDFVEVGSKAEVGVDVGVGWSQSPGCDAATPGAVERSAGDTVLINGCRGGYGGREGEGAVGAGGEAVLVCTAVGSATAVEVEGNGWLGCRYRWLDRSGYTGNT